MTRISADEIPTSPKVREKWGTAFINVAVAADSVAAVCYLEAVCSAETAAGSADSPEVVRSAEAERFVGPAEVASSVAAQRPVGFAEAVRSALVGCSADSPAAKREEPVGFGSKPEPTPSPDPAPA